ncbi:MAG: hypothetical protein Q8Q62_01520 [Mesorhizobium sp.]|nr:hypothetical protein [Mesorhizobium sp.]
MPLQNRVDPFGEIKAVPQRGMLMGNRGGAIHDPETKTLLKRKWASKAWIICVCEFKGKKRELMGRNPQTGSAGWTELFFLDEVTALAAGHRPCFYCRRERATDFLGRHRAATGTQHSAPELDDILHSQRLATGAKPVEVDRLGLSMLPDGAMFSEGGADFAIRNGRALRWSFSGYGAPMAFDEFDADEMCIVTPAASIAVLAAGYAPVWHPSAGP